MSVFPNKDRLGNVWIMFLSVAASKSNSQAAPSAPHILTSRQKEEEGSWGCFWTGNYLLCLLFFCSNTVFPSSCVSDPGQIFSWAFRSPHSQRSRSANPKPNVHRIQLLCILVALRLSYVSVAVSVSSGKVSEVEHLFCSSHISNAV